jgi:hypothetical protein
MLKATTKGNVSNGKFGINYIISVQFYTEIVLLSMLNVTTFNYEIY